MIEQWKPVVGYEGAYEVSDLGRLRSVTRVIPSIRAGKPFQRIHQGQLIAPRINRWGYQQIHLGKETTTHSVHKLVATAFHGVKPSQDHQVNHMNGVKTDNRSSNLEWVSRSQNMSHAYSTGLGPRGEQSSRTKLTSVQVQELRQRRKQGETLSSLAKSFGISVAGAHAIATGKTWAHVGDQP